MKPRKERMGGWAHPMAHPFGRESKKPCEVRCVRCEVEGDGARLMEVERDGAT